MVLRIHVAHDQDKALIVARLCGNSIWSELAISLSPHRSVIAPVSNAYIAASIKSREYH
jgi:hypothetical protein